MLISRAVYEVFYPLIRAKFFEVELKGVLPVKAHKLSSAFIWDEVYSEGKHKGEIMSIVLFGGGTNDRRYFYRMYSRFNSPRLSEDHIDDTAFYKGLLYLRDPELARKSNTTIINLKLQLDELYDEFTFQYRQQIIAAHNAPRQRGGNRPTTNDMPPAGDEESEQPITEMMNNDFESVQNVISKFYDNISIKSLANAWEQLSPQFQLRVWKNDFARFESGYVNTRGIRNVSIKNLTQSAHFIVDCIVSYEDEIEAHSTIELDSLSGMTVKDLDSFVNVVNRLKEDIQTWGGTNFDKIELYKLFEPAASEYVWYKCNLPVDKLEEVFSRKKTVFINRNYICTCHKIDDKWYLERIRPTPTYSTR